MTPENKKIAPEAGLRTETEKEELMRIAQIFNSSPDTTEKKLENFPKYIRRQKLTRLLALYEIFKKILTVKGSII